MLPIPNVVTHGLMALDVYNKLEVSQVKEVVCKHPKAFLLGSNGPDILFYYNVFPWQDQKENKKVASYGNRVHTDKVNDFYKQALSFIQKVQDPYRKEVLISYLAGHFLHWSLDSLAHPFVFYRSGEIADDTRYWHFRYESALDALMVTYVKKRQLKDLKATRFVDVNDSERRIIASFYTTILKEVFDIDTQTKFVDDAIKNFKKALKFLYDPYNTKLPLIQSLEKRIAESWALSSHVVNAQILDAHYDELNLKKEAWCNPTDDTDTSNASFIELYDYSVKLGVHVLNELDKALQGQREDFDDILQDRQYDTGRSSGEMKFFDCVYNR